MSATTLTQTTIKTQSVTGSHNRHQPLLVSTSCIIQPPTIEHHRRPVRCSARLSSQNSSSAASSIPTATPITTKTKRRRATTKNSRTNQLRLSIRHSGPSLITTTTSEDPNSSYLIPIDRPQPIPLHPKTNYPAHLKPFPSLLPLQIVSPIADKLSPQPCSLSFTFLFPPHLPQSPLLSFPKTPILSHLVFHFPLSTPARHLPPPHPGPRPLISPPSHPQPLQDHHHHHLLNHFSQSSPIWSPTSQSYRPRNKRWTALPQEQHLRSKKIKLHHSFFRSPQVFYPVDYSLNTPTSSSNPSEMSSRSKIIENPKWIHTSPAAQGQSSKMRPHEAHWTGNPENWMANANRSFTNRASSSVTSLPKIDSPVKPHRIPEPASTGGPQTAPLKAQLLAVLRMRSSLQPGEAALRLKKWVIWNSWVRGRGRTRIYPIVNPNPMVIVPSPSRTPSRISSSPGDEWTGNEMFDDNGDLVCEEEEEDTIKRADDRSQCSSRQGAEGSSTITTESSVSRKSQTIIKLKIPPRTSTPRQYPLQPTPPASPVSHNHLGQAPSAQKNTNGSGPSPPGSQAQLVTTAAHQSPLTPPPSPPNQHSRH